MEAISHFLISVSICLFISIFLIKENNWKHLLLIILIFGTAGGCWFIDPIDHYRLNLSFQENINFQYRVGVLANLNTPELELTRDFYSFNFFHKWEHYVVFSLLCFFGLIFFNRYRYYIISFMICYGIHLLCDMNIF